jgi:hypothetical protein
MRLRKVTFALLLAVLVASPVLADLTVISRPIRISKLPACTYQRAGTSYAIKDGATSSDCSTGGGTSFVVCGCAGGVWGASSGVQNAIVVTGQVAITANGAGNDITNTAADNFVVAAQDFLPTASATAVIVAPDTTITASTSLLVTSPKASFSGVIERAVTNVTVADDAAGTKPAGVTPITTDFATCTCNDATGCTMSVAEPTPTAGYGRTLTIVSAGTGNCEYADSAGVTEIGSAVVLEPTSVLALVYANAAWHRLSTADNVP